MTASEGKALRAHPRGSVLRLLTTETTGSEENGRCHYVPQINSYVAQSLRDLLFHSLARVISQCNRFSSLLIQPCRSWTGVTPHSCQSPCLELCSSRRPAMNPQQNQSFPLPAFKRRREELLACRNCGREKTRCDGQPCADCGDEGVVCDGEDCGHPHEIVDKWCVMHSRNREDADKVAQVRGKA